MILWDETKKQLNIDKETAKWNDYVIVECNNCKLQRKIRKSTLNTQLRCSGNDSCQSCKVKENHIKYRDNYENSKLLISQSSKITAKKTWEKFGYGDKYKTISFKNKISKISKSRYKNVDYKNKMKLLTSSNEFKNKVSKEVNKIVNTDEHKEKMKNSSKKIWENKEFKEIQMKSFNDRPKCISSLQNILYSILDDLNIKYYREYHDKPADKECVIGPWSFDCAIPLKDGKILLIECQGEYWHNKKEAKIRDLAKQSYIVNNMNDKYELKYIWEHEFKCKNKISESLKYWTGITKTELIDFNFENILIKIAKSDDYKLLLSKYHYLPNAGKGGIAYGAHIDEELIGVCIFSPLIRQNLPHDYDSTKELSRLCIHPKYQKKNFASWLISKCIKALPNNIKTIISYCDTTFNHDGTIYKASNFKLDTITDPDYWYVNKDGWVMHKKTLWNHAKKMSITENEYAELNKYNKIYGKEKMKFIYER